MNNNGPKDNHYIQESLAPDQARSLMNNENFSHLQAILNSNPQISAIVNRQRQIVLSNEHLVKIAGMESLDSIIGNRPGETFNCINIADGKLCSTTDQCKYCGINRTLQESQIKSERVSGECRITTQTNRRLVAYDFHITCAPIHLSNEHYTLLNMVDISSEKRNEMLEKVFFHDLLNRLGGFDGLIKIIKSENKQSELDEFIDLLNTIGELTIEDIQMQQYLRAAENANLILNIQEHSAFDIVESVRRQISFHPAMQSKSMMVCSECTDFLFKTDDTLLKRVLLNMVKNAAEATPDEGTFDIICKNLPGMAVFSVRNAGIIPYDIRMQIFQRSFSTKGNGRGLGTYSMKLFGENYLRGRVYFTSDEKEGTVFTIELPLE
jgi:K+-sensing histidine kinase KdpD